MGVAYVLLTVKDYVEVRLAIVGPRNALLQDCLRVRALRRDCEQRLRSEVR